MKSPRVTRRWERSGNERQNTIEARGLTKRYGDKLAVDALNFDIKPGHVTGFLGPNGAGKSTTMRMIMGLDTPDAGTVTVNGLRYHDLGWPLREVGALLEARAIHPGRSARAHLWMLARTNQIPRARVDEVLDLVGLSSVAGQRVGQFSLGMSQRLGIAVALLGDPGVLMFDEPVNGLDTDGIRWVRTLLRRLASEGRAIFVSSHLMSEMALTADHVVVIGKGRLIAEMPIDEFTARNSNAYIRVRSPDLDQLRSALEGAGATVTAGETDVAFGARRRPKSRSARWHGAQGSCSTNCRPNRHLSRRPLWNLPKGTLSSVAAALRRGEARRTVRDNDNGDSIGHPRRIRPKKSLSIQRNSRLGVDQADHSSFNRLDTPGDRCRRDRLGRHSDLRTGITVGDSLARRPSCVRPDPLQLGRSAFRPIGHRGARDTGRECGVQHRNHQGHLLGRAASAPCADGEGRSCSES